MSEVHQIKTGKKSPEGNPAVLLVLENLRSKYGTKFFLLDPNPVEEKGWIYPTESSLPVAGVLIEFQQTPYRSMQVSNIKGTPDAESTQVPMVTSIAKKVEGRLTLGDAGNPLEIDPVQEKKEEQWEFIRDEVEKMKEAWEDAQREQQRLRKEQEMIEKQQAIIETKGSKGFRSNGRKPKTPF